MTRYYWQARLVEGGPFVALATFFGPPLVDGEYLDRSERWQAIVRLETTGRAVLYGDHIPTEVDGLLLRNIEPITEAQHRWMNSHADYSTKYEPHNPDAAPTEAIDWNKRKTVF